MKRILIFCMALLAFAACDKAEEIHPWEQPYMGELSIDDPFYNTIFKSLMSGVMEIAALEWCDKNGEELLVVGLPGIKNIMFLNDRELVMMMMLGASGQRYNAWLCDWRVDSIADESQLIITIKSNLTEGHTLEGTICKFHLQGVDENGFTLKYCFYENGASDCDWSAISRYERSSMSRKEFIRTYIEGNGQLPKR